MSDKFEPKRIRNEDGSTMTITRWMLETPAGWIGGFDRAGMDWLIAEVRRDALREAAKVCESRATAPQGEDVLAVYYGCADAIRALIVESSDDSTRSI